MDIKYKLEYPNLRQKAEELLSHELSESISQLSEVETKRLLYELQVHQIELELQNEELILAHEKTAISSEKYIELYNFAPSGYFTLSRKGEIIELNPCGAAMLGREPLKLKNSLFQFFVTDDTKLIFNLFFENLCRIKTKETCEVTLNTDDDQPVYVHLTGVASPDNEMYFITATDITDSKLARALLKSDKRYLGLIDNLEAGVVVHAPDTSILINNTRASELLGLSNDQIKGKIAIDPAWKFVNDDQTPLPINEYPVNRIVTSKEPIKDQIMGIVQPGKNNVVWLTVNGFPMLSNSGNITEIVISFIDITERKLMEDTQVFLLQISNPESDENFFESLAKYLSKCLDMEYVCIDLLEGDGLTAKTLAVYNEGNFDPNVSYTLKDTPCGSVVGNHICCYPQEVRSLFPQDAALEDIKAESYIGTTLWSFDGKPIGLIAVIGQKPLHNQELAASVLKLVSLRASGKLEARLAEEKLKESEEKFRVLIESTSVAISLINLNGKCTYVNPKWCEIAKLSFTEALGDGWVNGIYAEDREQVFENWQRMIASEGNWGFEYRFGTPDKMSWVYGTAKSYKNDIGQIVGFIGSNVDITERKHFEDELKISKLKVEESEEFFRSLFENSPVGKSLTGLDGTLKTNRAFSNMLGYSFDEFQTKNFRDITHPDDVQLTIEAIESLLQGKESVIQFEKKYLHKNGSIVYADVVTTLQKSSDGKPLFFITSVNDITIRKQIEAELKKNEERLRDIIFSSGDWVWETDECGIYTYCSNQSIDLLGRSPEELLGKRPFDFMPADEAERIAVLFEDFAANKLPITDMENWNVKKNGERICLLTNGVPILDKEGNLKGYRGVDKNITQRKIFEAELIKAKEQAEESDKLKSSFLANMSHEIRTPLNSIIGFSDLLNDPDFNQQQKLEFTKTIIENGDNLMVIISDIMDLSMISAGQMRFRNELFSPYKMLVDLENEFSRKAVNKGIELRLSTPSEVQNLVVENDNYRTKQILTNLVNNAIKFTSHGFVEFGYILKDNCIQYYIKDTGIGIAPEYFEAIFNRFRQLDITKTRRYGGNGLGLAISKNLAELLGGKLWVESELGKGSTFHFSIPILSHKSQNNIAQNKLETSSNEIQIRNLKILIAEDDEASSQLISIDIRKFAREIIVVQTGTEAVEICRNHPDIDLVLMDIQMPELDGHEATRQIRKFNPELVIIAQTAFALSGDKEKAIEAGCSDYISKPMRRDELEKMIRKYFRNKISAHSY